MKLKNVFILILAVFFFQGCKNYNKLAEGNSKPNVTCTENFYPDSYDKIAVLVSEGNDEYSGLYRRIESIFIQEALTEGFTIAARSDVDKITDELKFQASGATARDFKRIGNFLNVSALLIIAITNADVRDKPGITQVLLDGAFSSLEASASLEARLISIEKGNVLWLGTFEGAIQTNDEDGFLKVIPLVSKKLASSFPECR